MANAKRTAGTTGKMIADCSCCKGWQAETRGRIAVCRFSDGVTHAAPEIWIASRANRIEQENPGMSPLDAWGWAWQQWAFNCEVRAVAEQAAA
jgi:hypothetical protein